MDANGVLVEGKYEGCHPTDLSTSDLHWCARQRNADPRDLLLISDELRRRDRARRARERELMARRRGRR